MNFIKDPGYALCDRCMHYKGYHSTVFGECWTCGKHSPVCSEIMDNHWEVSQGNEPTECEFYEFGEHLVDVVIG